MAPQRRTKWLAACCARITGDPGRKVSDGKRYRVRLTTKDGFDHAVAVQVDLHRKWCLPYATKQVASDWRMIADDAFIDFLEKGTNEQLIAHLAQFTKAELDPPPMKPSFTPLPAPRV